MRGSYHKSDPEMLEGGPASTSSAKGLDTAAPATHAFAPAESSAPLRSLRCSRTIAAPLRAAAVFRRPARGAACLASRPRQLCAPALALGLHWRLSATASSQRGLLSLTLRQTAPFRAPAPRALDLD